MSIPVLYRDEYLIAVNKPAGMLSVPGRGPSKADCVVSRAATAFGWIREVHRLDQATSGILLLARDAQTHRLMSRQFADRQVLKTYEALCRTLPVDPQLPGVSCVSGRIVVFQRLDTDNRPRQLVDPSQGKESITDWRLLERRGIGGPFRLLIIPRTGRTHQIRLALSVCGAPIVGDSLYGDGPCGAGLCGDGLCGDGLCGDGQSGGGAEWDVPGRAAEASRLMLHATRLAFEHPLSGQRVLIESEPPF